MRFDTLGLSPKLLEAVAEAGYQEPTPIQAQAIPEVLAGKDVLGIAQTGTGKTASFTLPMIDRLAQGRARARMPRSLILEPTRELASQVADNFETYGKNHKLSMALLIGGVSFADQEKELNRGVDVLIATPGRLLDHVGRGRVMLTGVQILVIDEADRMLDMGFIPDIEKICKLIPFTRQTLFFSATMPPEIQRLTETFLQAPVRLEVASPSSAAETVEQAMITVASTPKAKREALRQLVRQETALTNGIIFCNRKRDVDVVERSLAKHDFSVVALHGDMDQSVRMARLASFKNGEVTLLVASDVAARGLDIPAVSHVFNFDVPTHAEDYIHRIGRTGRAGREGKTFMISTKSDRKYVDAIKSLLGKDIPEIKLDGLEVSKDDGAEEDTSRSRGRRRGREKTSSPKRAKTKAETSTAVKSEKADLKSNDRKSENKPRSNQRRGRRDDSIDNEPSAVGLGDHVPAFLLKPTS